MDDSDIAPRQWWVAGLLTLFGLFAAGYLYVGRPVRAVVGLLVFLAFGIAFATGLGGMWARPLPLIVALALQVIAALFFVVDSARIALHERAYRTQPYNQNWVYAAAVVAGVLLSGYFKPGIQSFEVSSESMMPTLLEGDRLLVDTTARVPKRGTLVAMIPPSDPGIVYLRRVVGVPGDRVQMVNGVLQLNGAPVAQAQQDTPAESGTIYRETLPDGASYLILDRNAASEGDNTGIFEISDGVYFVLGDSRDNAVDSRRPEIGEVPAGNIIGAVTAIFWSPDTSRIGTTPE